MTVGSAIEWTDETWNPTVGCSKVSPGCDHCYAVNVAHRAMQPAHAGLTLITDDGPDWTGEVRCLPDRLDTPLHWRKPRRVFVDSMSDLFHADVPDAFVERVFDVMIQTEHTFQVLTKRPQRMAAFVESYLYPALLPAVLDNVWLGTSIESDRYAWRANHLRDTKVPTRFLSLEPLLGPLPSLNLTGIQWVIVGGESGPGARPMHPNWVRDIRDRCVAAGVPFFFKQWGSWAWTGGGPKSVVLDDGAGHFTKMWNVGKKAAGRMLDGRTWDESPTIRDRSLATIGGSEATPSGRTDVSAAQVSEQ